MSAAAAASGHADVGVADDGVADGGIADVTERRVGFLSLGSNLGDRRANLQLAADALAASGVQPCASSSLYATAPVGLVLDQPEFLNACLRIATTLAPGQLLTLCKGIESQLGRVPGPRHSARLIDVDILLLGELELRGERLTLPHRELHRRRFVLVPLLELDPSLRLPDGTSLSDALRSLGDEQAVRLAGPPLRVGRAL